MNKLLLIYLTILFFCLPKLANSTNELNIATIRILDKITAQSTIKDIKIGDNFDYGDLSIKIHKCWNAPPQEKPETKMLISIYDNTMQQKIFFGWLFSSSPSISSIEHPIYDITSIICK